MIFGSPLFGKAGFTPMEFISSSGAAFSSSTITIPAPTSIEDDDYLFSFIATGSTSVTVSPPSGFSQLADVSGEGQRVYIFVKKAVSESGSYVFTGSFFQDAGGIILNYRGARGLLNAVGAAIVDGEDAPLPSISPTKRGNLISTIIESGGNAVTPPSGVTLRGTVVMSAAATLKIFDENPTGTGPTGTRNFAQGFGFLAQIT